MGKALSGELSCMQAHLVSSLAQKYRKSCYTHTGVCVSIPFCIEVSVNPIALRKTKIACHFGLSECNMVKVFCYVMGKAVSAKLSCMLSYLFPKSNDFFDSLFASMDDKTFLQCLLLKERILLPEEQILSLKG